MQVLILSFFIAFGFTLLLIHFDHLHLHLSGDHVTKGAQKYHVHPVPRIGGVPIMLAMLAAVGLLAFRDIKLAESMALLMVAGMPAFIGGLMEDVTKKVGVGLRLGLTCFSAVLAYLLFGALLSRLDLPWIDPLLAYWPVALALTAVAVGGVANAVNIIDGYNGLAAMVCVLILAALGYVGYQVGDALVWNTAIAMVGGSLGFMVWNWPRGMIFLGDGGAYFKGFMIGELSVLLVMRNPQVSAWFPLLLVVYPVFETLFSVYRKKVIRGMSPGMPDAVHLHMLIHKRVVRFAVGTKLAELKMVRNSLTSPYLWVLCSLSVFPAVMLWQNTLWLQILVGVFVLAYLWLYRAMVRFKVPRLLLMGGGNRTRGRSESGGV
ncbi:MraY family glycosyltransferase [Crenobacter cavernae]|uniref:Glycosyl transferase n=1 Tax=Crenobacter cavernae TaxID=2290923 RepID=A0A345Y2A0_9NEIS|nr:glycosyltransferase [Crenobacter cavernae]AXK38052.1 glycosyl transferase [Crenobacter cavernae]